MFTIKTLHHNRGKPVEKELNFSYNRIILWNMRGDSGKKCYLCDNKTYKEWGSLSIRLPTMNLSHAIAKQGLKGNKWQFDVKAVYGVFFLNFLLDENRKLRTDVILADRETGELFSDKLRQIFIALPLFKKEEDECETDFERWIFVLNNMETLNRMPFKAKKAVFEKLEEIADVHSLSEEERARYENSVNAYRDYLATVDFAAKEGLEEGLAKGLEQGKIEKAIETARYLKAAGISQELITGATGLSAEEIERL